MQSTAAEASPVIKRYTIKDTWKGYVVTLEVNHSILTPERAQQINTFWTSHEDRLDQCDGDVVKTVIQLFGQETICLYLSESGASFGDKDQWLIDKESKEKRANEGWGGESMEGEDNGAFGWCGIRIVGADVGMPEFDELSLEEKQA